MITSIQTILYLDASAYTIYSITQDKDNLPQTRSYSYLAHGYIACSSSGEPINSFSNIKFTMSRHNKCSFINFRYNKEKPPLNPEHQFNGILL